MHKVSSNVHVLNVSRNYQISFITKLKSTELSMELNISLNHLLVYGGIWIWQSLFRFYQQENYILLG